RLSSKRSAATGPSCATAAWTRMGRSLTVTWDRATQPFTVLGSGCWVRVQVRFAVQVQVQVRFRTRTRTPNTEPRTRTPDLEPGTEPRPRTRTQHREPRSVNASIYRMPAEWEPHRATWIAWPHH